MYTPRNWHRAHKASLSRGDRAADRLRNSMLKDGVLTISFGKVQQDTVKKIQVL